MNEINKLDVFYHDMKVGTLAEDYNYRVAFQYDMNWISKGFSISPLSLPLTEKVYVPNLHPFDGVFGVFADSLPDGWGRLLVDRFLKEKGINPAEINTISRLAIVGDTGMGALSYKPNVNLVKNMKYDDLDELCASCKAVLNSQYTSDLDLLFELGGSSGGARPKILTNYDNEEWIIKFPSSYDSDNIGKMEFDYMNCAKDCGIIVPECRLFPSKKVEGYFGVKRFDRVGQKKIHMITASGLLETSHRLPNLDYNDLMKLTMILTDDFSEVEKMFRLMTFNVFAHNRDDHSKNFSFIFNESLGKWQLSPAYDLTYSSSIGGEHATTVNGKGKNPQVDDIISVGEQIGLSKDKCSQIVNEIKDKVHGNLREYIEIKK